MTYKIDKHHTNVISKGWALRDEDGSAVAYVLGTDEGEAETIKRLIAAAPGLYDFISRIARISTSDEVGEHAYFTEEDALTLRLMIHNARSVLQSLEAQQ